MEPTDAGRLMWRDERKFAWQVGVALAVLGALRLWREATTPARAHVGLVLVAAAVALVVTGTLAPRLLVWPRRAWMALGDRLQRVVSPVVSALLYYLLVTPIGWLRRTLGRSPIARDHGAASFWVSPREGAPSAEPRHDKPY
jgi:hypothetical protein